jgi:Sulfotransferase family
VTETRSPNPYVFVVGCPRSGTTLLRRMLDAHPDLAMTPETHWIPKLLERGRGVTREGLVSNEVVDEVVGCANFDRMGIDRDAVASLLRPDEPLRYADFVRGFFDLYGRVRGKRLVGDKTPGYVRRLPILNDLFPAARFVHLIRDGRDVVLSALGWRRAPSLAARHPTWSTHPVPTAALWWERHVRAGRDAVPAIGSGRYFEVRYETLVADPRREARRLCAFLELPFDDAMVRFHEGRKRDEDGLSAKKAWLPPTPGLRNWETEMSPEDVERFEAAAGELLDELGYRRAVPNPPARARALAAAVRSAA